MEQLPIAAPSCSLTDAELGEQVARYRAIGDGAKVLEWSDRRRSLHLAESVPERLVQRTLEIERECCPFYELLWDGASRRLTISVAASGQEPALDAICHALGLRH